MKLLSSLWWVAVPAILWGCQPEIPQDPEPSGDRVVAVFDPATSTIPLPNTAALEEDGTLPNLGAGTEGAEADFFAWLDMLHGWSESTPIVVPFSGELDPETVNSENVRLWRVQDDGSFTDLEANPVYLENDEEGSLCDPSVCESIIMIVPAQPLEFGARYAAVVTKGVEGAGGEPVAEAAPIFFAASAEPLYNFETGEVAVSVLEDDPAQAATLEGLRMLLAPVFQAAIDEGISRNQIATAFTWTVANDPFTVLDPDTATLPIPNVIALEPDGTFPAAALDFCGGPGVDPEVLADDSCDAPSPEWRTCEISSDCDQYREQGDPAVSCVSGRCVYARCAQGEFDTYLDGLHGWPTTTPITLPVSAPIDETTLSPETVQLWRVDADGTPTRVEEITVSLTECGDEILITPPAPMDYNTSYFAFATREIESTNTAPSGEQLELIPSAPILLSLMPNDPGQVVADCTAEQAGAACDGGGVCGAIPGEGFKCIESTISRVSDADAAAVMGVRPAFRSAVVAIEAATDLDWDDLAAAWTWTTWTDTFLVFDPTAAEIPFPNTFLTTGCPPEEPICLLPTGEGPTGAILAELREREGFSTTAPNWIPILGPLPDPATVNSDTVLFAEADEIPPPIFDAYDATLRYDHIIVEFERPLKPDILVAGLTTTDIIGANGFPAQPTPAFVFLRSTFPLIDQEGNRTVSQIPSDEVAAVLESARQQFDQLFLVALLFGYGRDEVNNAWAYGTGDTYQPLLRLRALTLAKIADDGVPQATANSPDVWTAGDGPVTAPDDVTTTVDVSNLAAIHWNVEFDTYDWIGADNRIVDLANTSRETVPVSIFIPQDTVPGPGGCEAPYDVAIAQHGHTGFRKPIGLSIANELAAECIATIAMDLPLHGGRIPGSPMLHPDSTPPTSGDGFISGDFPATVALFQQSAIDLVVLTQLIKNGAFDTAVGGTFSGAASQVGYVGQSLGSFIGTLFLTVDPIPTGGVINAGGGNFSILLTESEAFAPLLAQTGIPADTFEELQALHFIQWLGEHVDPYVFAPYTVQNPLVPLIWTGTDFVAADMPMEPKDVLIQMIQDDMTVPNAATVLLAEIMGVPLVDTTFPADTTHGFLTDLDAGSMNAEQAACARMQIAAWLNSSFAGDAMLPAALSATTCIAAQ